MVVDGLMVMWVAQKQGLKTWSLILEKMAFIIVTVMLRFLYLSG